MSTGSLRLLTLATTFVVVLLLGWFSQHQWLLNPSLYQWQAKAATSVGLSPLTAQRPDLLTIAGHAKLRDVPDIGRYSIQGQLYNPRTVPIRAPSILLQQIDRDNRIVKTLRFPPNEWQQPSSSVAAPVPAQQLLNFELALNHWPSNSWGYQLRLVD